MDDNTFGIQKTLKFHVDSLAQYKYLKSSVSDENKQNKPSSRIKTELPNNICNVTAHYKHMPKAISSQEPAIQFLEQSSFFKDL